MKNCKTWKKRVTSVLLSLVMVATLLPLGLVTEAKAAMSGYTAWTSKTSLPTSGTYYLNYDVTLSGKI